MTVLQLSAHFKPNLGGVETHLDDLVNGLVKRKIQTIVLSYIPLTTDVSAPIHEKSSFLEIFRIPWIKGLFYKLVETPFLEFLYLLPGLFFVTPFLLWKRKVDVIHAHGLVAGFVGVFWAKLMDRRVVISTHSIYNFPKKSFYTKFVQFIFKHSDQILCLSNKSVDEVISLGISTKKVKKFTYWINLKLFKPLDKKEVKQKFNLSGKFVVLFVGRLVEVKGIKTLIEAFKRLNNQFILVVAGDGPLKDFVIKSVYKYDNIKYAGRLNSTELVSYYNAADLLVIPSIHEEGFGRVILESLSSGTPVLASNRGSISEAMDTTVGRFIKVGVQTLLEDIAYLKKHPNVLKKLSLNAHQFAAKKYSEKNINVILKSYKQSLKQN